MRSPSGSPPDMTPAPPPPQLPPSPPRRPEEVSREKNDNHGMCSSRVTPRCTTGAETFGYPSLSKSLSEKENSKTEYPLKEGDIPTAPSIKSFSGMPPPPPPPGPPPKRSSAPSKAKRNVSTKNNHNASIVIPGEEVPQCMPQKKECDANKVIPKDTVNSSPFTPPLPEALQAQLMHQKNQRDMNHDVSRGKISDVVGTSPRLGAPVIQKQENWHQMSHREVSRDNPLGNDTEVRSMSPKLGVPVRSLSPKLGPPVMEKEDHEMEVLVEDKPQTRRQMKHSDAKRVIPPGAVKLSPFGKLDVVMDFKAKWPSSPHGRSPKKTWTRGFSPRELNDDAGVKRMDSPSRQLHEAKNNKCLGTATAETSPSTGKCFPAASAPHVAEPANTFFEDKSSASPQSKQLETNNDIPKDKMRANIFGGSSKRESSTDLEPTPVTSHTFSPCQAATERSITEKSKRDDFLGTTPSNEGSQRETRKEEISTGKAAANAFGGPPTIHSSTENKSGPVASSCPFSQATTERSNPEKSASDDGFLGTTSTNEGLDPWFLPMRPSNQLFPMDEAKWGASVMNSPVSNESEFGNDWFQSTSFGSETKGADAESKWIINAAMSKSQAHGVTAMVSKPFSSASLAPKRESSSTGNADLAISQTRDLASLTANLDDETSDLAGVEHEEMTKEAKKEKKWRRFFNFLGGDQNKGKKDKVTQSKKEKASISWSASMKGDLSVQSVQSTSSQRKKEKATQPKRTKASSRRNAATKGDQSVQSVLPVSSMLSLPSTTTPKEFSLNAIKTKTPDTEKRDGPNVNPAMKLSSHVDKLHETAAPGFEEKEARLHESRGPAFKTRSNTLVINQNLDCEVTVVSETTNPAFVHDKTSVDESTVFQESSCKVDSKTSKRQKPTGAPKISSLPDPFDVTSKGVSSGDPFAAAALQSNACPMSESVFVDDNFFSSFPSDHVISPKSQQSEPKPDVVADDSADTGETPLEMVDTVSSDEDDVDKLAKTIGAFQGELQAVPSGMTTNHDKAGHAMPASRRESDNVNTNSRPCIGKLCEAPSSKPAFVAEDSVNVGNKVPLEVVYMALSHEEDNVDELVKSIAGEVQNALQGALSYITTGQDKVRDPVPASPMESDNVNANSSHSHDKLRSAPRSSMISPILLQKERRKQASESPVILVQKPSFESKCDPSDESAFDPTSTDQTSQTPKGSSSTQRVDETHLDPPSTSKRHSITSNTEKQQSDVTVSSGDQPKDHHGDTVPDSLVRLHSSIQSERARLIALKQRRNRVGKRSRMSATVPPENPYQSKGRGKSGDDNIPKDQQLSIVASARASESQPEMTGGTAREGSPSTSVEETLPLEEQLESKERKKSADDILPEAQKHSPVAAMIASSSATRSQFKGTSRTRSREGSPATSVEETLPLEEQTESKEPEKSSDDVLPEAQKHSPVAVTIASSSATRSQLKGTSRTRSIAKNLRSRRHDTESNSLTPDRKPLQPCSPNN